MFHKFAKAVSNKFTAMSKHAAAHSDLYVTDVDGDELWDQYLASFPEGTNKMFRERTEHDCTTCSHFIRRVGNLVTIVDGKVDTVWDIEADYPYDEVAKALAERVRAANIVSVFRTVDRQIGKAETLETAVGAMRTWHHFSATVVAPFYDRAPATKIGAIVNGASMLRRALKTLTASSLDVVVDLITSDCLYRGAEHLHAVKAFQALKAKADGLTGKALDLFIWSNASNPVSLFRNTVIGTLVVDLSEGMDLETAVHRFTNKVDPTNYQRPTAIITKGMVASTMKTIEGLGLRDALDRRHAVLEDVSINDVLWASRKASAVMRDGIEDLLMGEAAPSKATNAAEIGIEDFVKTILPKATSMEVMLEGRLSGNLVSLTAPVHDTKLLFKWDNNFAWSYAGGVTDAIRERVKAAGGDVNALLRCSLAWFNHDDLDLHADACGTHIYFANKCGVLDVDMNAGRATTREPVENLSWRHLKDGHYSVFVRQYNCRETTNTGFTIQLAYKGAVHELAYDKPVRNDVNVVAFDVRGGEVKRFHFSKELSVRKMSQDTWGMKTETWVPVSTVMLSPNFWNDQKIGNKHWMFMLEGCRNPDPVRGFYNEFLRPELSKHRKEFEILGSKTAVPYNDNQLSGLGFSSTVRNSIDVRVKGDKLNAVYTVKF